MIRIFVVIGLLMLCLLPGTSPAAGPVDTVIAGIRAECAAIDNGVLTVETGAVRSMDLTGDGKQDAVIDGQDLSCSSSRTLFCGGTGGCRLFLMAGGTVTEEMSKGWTLARLGQMPVVLLQVHGSECGGTNLRRCVKALVWSDGAFRAAGDQTGRPKKQT